jgi:vancomycin resistance protein YoaR
VGGIAKQIDVSPKNATLKMADGKATVFQTAVIGKKVDQSQLKIDIENALFARISADTQSLAASTLTIKVAETKPEISDDAINDLGIVDLISTGTTDFKGSPTNRVHNIQVGVASINGALLKPGETFSTLGHLGTIDAAGGYLPELVIKDNRTTPEYGGGLCQVSTTLFRAAMNAGLRIDQRQNHKYRVSYYEPPVGMDATIYDPAPDFKFTNTYSSHILIQGYITGTKITFEIYGTKDSRAVEISTPTITAVTDPPAPSYVETDTLAPGEKKLLEKAHQGATVNFRYKVTKDGQTLQEKTFESVYVPWQEKWLIGKLSLIHISEPTRPY